MTASVTEPIVTDYSHGISAIDSGYIRPQLDAIHIVVEQGRVIVIDTGTNESVPQVLGALGTKGLDGAAIDYVFLTHVHLDHAGGAGLLMCHAPNATLVVHPRGLRHMVDPSKLMAATRAVYGDEATHAMYGDVLAIDADRIVEATDGSTVEWHGRTFTFHDTPGHARHHNCIHDSATGHLFAGDMFGVSYRELDRDGRPFVFPATTPSQFDPDAFHASIERMTALRPEALYLTHYGRVFDVPRLAVDLLRLVDAHADLARRCASIDDRATRIKALEAGVRDIALFEASSQPWGLPIEQIDDVLAMDIKFNADGLESWIASGAANETSAARSKEPAT
jgi:glyoxylase-like metal-dependent hydrolase (beta-lactamase superfamily II)